LEAALVPAARFIELLADIEPSPTTKSNASLAHTAVRKHLRSHPSFRNRWEGDFLAGSYARDTAIRPKKTEGGQERPDIDIIIETNFSASDKPDEVLEELCAALESEFTVERINKRSVRIVTGNAEIDVVPVIASGSVYQLPDRELGYWKATNPPGHIEWSSEQNTLFDGRFKPLVKLFKWWRRENKTGKRPKGFILEVLVSRHAPINQSNYGEAFAQMMEGIHAEYSQFTALGVKPTISDPSLPGSDILSKVSITDWQNFMERIRVHAGYARRAQGEDDMEEATRLWRRLFGDRFPTTANAAKAVSLGTYAAAPVAPTTGYTFPNVPAAPTKPRGFA
jgi:hypothetical protein